MTTVFMIRTAMAVITDSGGVQEEATAFAIPTIICRNSTDRTAHDEMAASRAASFDHTLLFKGQYILAGTETEKIVEAFSRILKNIDQRKRRKPSKAVNSRIYPAYGDGLASKRIVALIKEKFKMEPNEFPDPPTFSYDNWEKD
jgi:UDP-N-acetylglucosamine 2-epimerase (non-hydrolysing)